MEPMIASAVGNVQIGERGMAEAIHDEDAADEEQHIDFYDNGHVVDESNEANSDNAFEYHTYNKPSHVSQSRSMVKRPARGASRASPSRAQRPIDKEILGIATSILPIFSELVEDIYARPVTISILVPQGGNSPDHSPVRSHTSSTATRSHSPSRRRKRKLVYFRLTAHDLGMDRSASQTYRIRDLVNLQAAFIEEFGDERAVQECFQPTDMKWWKKHIRQLVSVFDRPTGQLAVMVNRALLKKHVQQFSEQYRWMTASIAPMSLDRGSIEEQVAEMQKEVGDWASMSAPLFIEVPEEQSLLAAHSSLELPAIRPSTTSPYERPTRTPKSPLDARSLTRRCRPTRPASYAQAETQSLCYAALPRLTSPTSPASPVSPLFQSKNTPNLLHNIYLDQQSIARLQQVTTQEAAVKALNRRIYLDYKKEGTKISRRKHTFDAVLHDYDEIMRPVSSIYPTRPVSRSPSPSPCRSPISPPRVSRSAALADESISPAPSPLRPVKSPLGQSPLPSIRVSMGDMSALTTFSRPSSPSSPADGLPWLASGSMDSPSQRPLSPYEKATQSLTGSAKAAADVIQQARKKMTYDEDFRTRKPSTMEVQLFYSPLAKRLLPDAEERVAKVIEKVISLGAEP